jgi:hypothetical protein
MLVGMVSMDAELVGEWGAKDEARSQFCAHLCRHQRTIHGKSENYNLTTRTFRIAVALWRRW